MSDCYLGVKSPLNMDSEIATDILSFTEAVIAEEKTHRINSSSAVVYPMKAFFFHGHDDVTALIGSPFRESRLDEKEQMSLAMRLFAHALDAHTCLHVTEGWLANRCAKCEAGAEESKDGRCGRCGSEIVPPSENPHREEALIATLGIKNQEKVMFWTSRFERDGKNKIIGFTDLVQRSSMEGSGRFMQVWALESWMMPHFAVNLCVVLRALGKEVDERSATIASVEKVAPADYPFVRANVEDVQVVVRRMRLGMPMGRV